MGARLAQWLTLLLAIQKVLGSISDIDKNKLLGSELLQTYLLYLLMYMAGIFPNLLFTYLH